MSAVELLDKAIGIVDALLARSSVNEPTEKVKAQPAVVKAVEDKALVHKAVEVKAVEDKVAEDKVAEDKVAEPVSIPEEQAPAPEEKNNVGEKKRKEKKEKKEKPAPAPAVSPALNAVGSPDAAFAKALIKVAKVLEVADVENSAKLYKTQLDLGNGEIRQVLTGLRQLVPRDQLEGHFVCVIVNLKTAKLAGLLSEGMILSADQQLEGGGELVRTIIPPAGSEPGDQVFLEGGAPSQTTVKTLKSEDWRKVAEGLRVGGDARACFWEQQLVTAKGGIVVPDCMPEGASIH